MTMYFIIPVYKTEKYLRRCVDSVLAQTCPDVFTVLVDDGSPDGSPAICDEYASKYDNVVVLHKENGGLSDARNHGIDYVCSIADKEDYITFLDSDDFVRSDYAEYLLSVCTENHCDSAQCGYEKGDKECFGDFDEDKDVFVVKSGEDMLLDQRLKSQSCSKVYKVKLFENVRFPYGVINEDEFTTYRAVYASKKVFLTDKKLYYYYQHNDSIMDNIAKRLKNNPHIFDWLNAYKERIAFFESENKPLQVMRTHEKICTDVILRYCEQMYLPPDSRDDALTDGEYMRIYKKSFPVMIKRKGISLKRRLMYIIFYIFPLSAVLPGKIFGLRK